MAVSFIGARNRSTWRKPPTCRKLLTNWSHNVISNTLHHGAGFELTTLVVIVIHVYVVLWPYDYDQDGLWFVMYLWICTYNNDKQQFCIIFRNYAILAVEVRMSWSWSYILCYLMFSWQVEFWLANQVLPRIHGRSTVTETSLKKAVEVRMSWSWSYIWYTFNSLQLDINTILFTCNVNIFTLTSSSDIVSIIVVSIL